ncbi:hypothetical protein SAMN04490248_1333 [Salinihabitans flavidus]|uniref:Uncharacterized protein n=1 Tax=Salinihabitans flavidus TaxID=569882 RepID=A0A1H8VRI8_9RHOB|nr:hypothetical protein [Salinihabitans flavidus]SEP17893.1 hypothetical protein SAMN04490248_1333 [Salinihabitans flavidus]
MDEHGEVIFSSDHVLAAISYVAGGAAFIHDTLMMPQSVASLADVPRGGVEDFRASQCALFDLLGDTPLNIEHNYPCDGSSHLKILASKIDPQWPVL